MRIALLSAAWPPVRCGVGDYTERLAEALTQAGAKIVRFDRDRIRFGTTDALSVAQALRNSKPDIIHTQYPAVGYGRSLLPASLPLLLTKIPVVATFHEYSIFRWYRWPWFAPFAYCAPAAIFTSPAERDCFRRRMPGARARLEVIPIGSNVPVGTVASRDANSVCYFGLIMPGKGVEEFLRLAAGLRATTSPWRIILIGVAPPGAASYAADIIRQCQAARIEMAIGLEPRALGDLLQTVRFAYLPGPGGITERRGTVLAALENGVQVLGPLAPNASPWLRTCVLDAPTSQDAVEALQAGRTWQRPSLTSYYAWTSIARRHLDLYDSLIGSRPTAIARAASC